MPLEKRRNKALQFDDKDICKYELVALCPNRLFRNTKSDLGERFKQQPVSTLPHTPLNQPAPDAWPGVCCAGGCGFEIHDDHLEWASVKEQWDKLPQREKDRWVLPPRLLHAFSSMLTGLFTGQTPMC